MPRRQRDLTWPFLVVLACLFVLSATAPRAWQRLARERTAEELIAEAAQQPGSDRLSESNPDRQEQEPVLGPDLVRVLVVEPAQPTEAPEQSDTWLRAEFAERLADRPVDAPGLPPDELPELEAASPSEATARPADVAPGPSLPIAEPPAPLTVASVPNVEAPSSIEPPPSPEPVAPVIADVPEQPELVANRPSRVEALPPTHNGPLKRLEESIAADDPTPDILGDPPRALASAREAAGAVGRVGNPTRDGPLGNRGGTPG